MKTLLNLTKTNPKSQKNLKLRNQNQKNKKRNLAKQLLLNPMLKMKKNKELLKKKKKKDHKKEFLLILTHKIDIVGLELEELRRSSEKEEAVLETMVLLRML